MVEADDDLAPERVRTTEEFLALLRELKRRSGRSYRELERRAAEQGDSLPRSTIADVMRRDYLPDPARLSALVRACGAQEQLPRWLHARARLDGGEDPSEAPPSTGPAPARSARLGRWSASVPVSVRALSVGILVVVLAVAGWTVLPGSTGPGSRDAAAGPAAADPAASPSRAQGWQEAPLPSTILGRIRIRPVTAPTLCLTDGRVLDRRYTPLVAVQRPCDAVGPQATTLAPTGDGTYRIVWDHPDYGLGCLTLLTSGPGAGLLEPFDDCEQASHFHVEPSGSYDSGTYVFRLAGHGCLGIRESRTTEGAEAVLERCVGRGSQLFHVEPVAER